MRCRLFGHSWVFRSITLPRQMFCRRCGKRAGTP